VRVKRVLLIMTVALLLVALVVANAAPVFAGNGKTPGGVKIGQHSSNPNDGNGKV
jgi:hypothetical protein